MVEVMPEEARSSCLLFRNKSKKCKMRTVYGITFTLVLMGLISLIIGVVTMNHIVPKKQQKAKAE